MMGDGKALQVGHVALSWDRISRKAFEVKYLDQHGAAAILLDDFVGTYRRA